MTREAHSIKGLAGTFGFQRLSALSGWLERNAKGLGADRYGTVLGHIEAAFEQAHREMLNPTEMAA